MSLGPTAPLVAGPAIAGLPTAPSRLALGTAFYRPEEADRCFAILDAFAAHGGTLIDTARQYGQSEVAIGAWLRARGARDRMIIISKCAHGDGLLPADDFEQVVSVELAVSLELLSTDWIDLYFLHRDNPAVPVGRILERLNREIDAGRVRAIGASNWEYPRVREANEYARAHGLAGFAAVSNNLSLAVPAQPFYPGLVSVGPDGEQWHQRTGTPLIAWSSQARGFFTGRYAASMRDQAGEDADPFTRRMLAVYGAEANFARLCRAAQLGHAKGGYSAVQVALAWLLGRPFPVIPVVGPHTPEEVASCVAAASLSLSAAEASWLSGCSG